MGAPGVVRRAIKPLVIAVTLHGSTAVLRAQAPGTVLPGPNNSAAYAESANRVIEAGVDVVKALPGGELRKALTEFSGDELKKWNDARARAERVMNNPQNAFLPSLPTAQEATLAPKDLDFVRNLATGDVAACATRSPLLCNGTPDAYGSVECSVGIPDRSVPNGWRNVTILTAQCLPEGGKLVGHIVAVVPDIHTYTGTYVTQSGPYLEYHGSQYAGFCLPCPKKPGTKQAPAPTSRAPATGKQRCIGGQFFGVCF
jgi:hypothetical protein